MVGVVVVRVMRMMVGVMPMVVVVMMMVVCCRGRCCRYHGRGHERRMMRVVAVMVVAEQCRSVMVMTLHDDGKELVGSIASARRGFSVSRFER